MPTSIYIIRARRSRQGRHIVKIGRTDSVPRRLAELQSASADRLEVVHEATAPGWVESMLHHEYAPRRIRGEWFSLTAAELDRAVQLIAGEVEPERWQAKRAGRAARARKATAARRRAAGMAPADGRARCTPVRARPMTPEELDRMRQGGR